MLSKTGWLPRSPCAVNDFLHMLPQPWLQTSRLMTNMGGTGTCKDDVHHGHEHAVFLWVPRVLDDGNHVGPLLGHVDKITPCKPHLCQHDGAHKHISKGIYQAHLPHKRQQHLMEQKSVNLCKRTPWTTPTDCYMDTFGIRSKTSSGDARDTSQRK